MKTARISLIPKLWLAMVAVLVLLAWAGIAGADAALDEQLIEAAGRGNVGLVKNCLEKGANINARNGNGLTPLIAAAGGNGWCIETDHLKIVELLINKGANVDAIDPSGTTALHKAAWVKNGTNMVRYLLDHGASVNAKDQSGRTPLLEAISGYNYGGQTLELLELLLHRGANVNAKTVTGKTPLMEAAAEDHDIVVEKWYEGLWKQLRYRLFGKQWVSWDRHGMRTPEAVELLLQNGADVNAKDQQGWTAMKRAQFRNGPAAREIVELLKAHGAKE
jgi:ankyrin repeat protein